MCNTDIMCNNYYYVAYSNVKRSKQVGNPCNT